MIARVTKFVLGDALCRELAAVLREAEHRLGNPQSREVDPLTFNICWGFICYVNHVTTAHGSHIEQALMSHCLALYRRTPERSQPMLSQFWL